MKLIDRLASRLRGPAYHSRKRVELELNHGEPEFRLVPLLADPDGIFLDVGANDGVYSVHAHPHFGEVVAVEAHPGMVTWLGKILGRKARIVAAALSDGEGTATLYIPLSDSHDVTTRCSLEEAANPGFTLRAVEVPMTTIDALALDRVSVIKIDVEGHELAALRGGTHTLDRDRPLCIVECEERHNEGGVAEAFAFFASLGYHPYFLHRGKLRDGASFDVAALQKASEAKQLTGGRSPDYINNFIFVHPDNAAGLERIRQHLG